MDQAIINLLKEGKAFAQEDHWEDAIKKWDLAVELSSFDSEIVSVVVVLLAGGGQLDQVIILIKKLTTFDPKASAALAAQTGLDRWEKQGDIVGAVQLSGLSLKIAEANNDIQQLAFTAGNLGNMLSAAGSLEASLVHYENAEKYYRQIGDTGWVSQMLSSAGGVLKDLQRHAEAKQKLEHAVEIASRYNHPSALTLALLNLGSLYGVLQNFEQSKVIHQKVLRLAWENQLPEYVRKGAGNLAIDVKNLALSGTEEAQELVEWAVEAFRQKQYDWAVFGLKCATLLVDRTMAPIFLADIYHTLSNVEYTTGEMKGAITHLEESRKLARAAQVDASLAEYSAGLSHLFLEQGELSAAADACDEAIASASRAQAYEFLATALGNRGIVALKQDKLQIAETLLNRQYKIARDKGFQKQCANAANALGSVREKMGDILAAEKWFDKSIEESENYKWPAGISALVNKAILQRRREDISGAISSYQDALIQAVGRNNFDLLFDVVFNLGILYVKKGEPEKARSYFDQAKEWNKGVNDPRKNALLDMKEAYLLKKEEKRTEALEKFRKAYTFFKGSDWRNAANCGLEAAILWLEAGELETAMEQILPVVELYEQRMERLSDYDAWRLHRDEELCFQVFLELTLQLHGPELGLIASERSRGRAFRLALRRREHGHRTKAFDYVQNLRKTALDVAISGKAKGVKKAYLEGFINVLSGAKDPEDISLEESWVREWAEKLNTNFIAFAKGYPDKLYVWVINQSEIRCMPVDLRSIGGITGLERCIKELREHLGIPERGAGTIRHKQEQNPGVLLQQLHNLLIEPLVKWLPEEEGAKIGLIPWGPLFEIPFCALLDNNGKYFVDKYATFIIPTFYFLASQQEAQGVGALIVGDPIPAQESSFGPLSGLPHAVQEARQVAELYQAEPLIGKEAHKKKILEQLSSARIVHFAAHGLYDEIYPLHSAIALTQTEDDSGMLYAADLKKMMLKNKLVVLSACSSALGNITGDGVLGLCREFLTAGTDCVVASIWAVGDQSSAFHMTRFHEALAEKSVVEALREAQLATKEVFGQVSQWGAYVGWGWPSF